jgi:hypothetical protein
MASSRQDYLAKYLSGKKTKKVKKEGHKQGGTTIIDEDHIGEVPWEESVQSNSKVGIRKTTDPVYKLPDSYFEASKSLASHTPFHHQASEFPKTEKNNEIEGNQLIETLERKRHDSNSSDDGSGALNIISRRRGSTSMPTSPRRERHDSSSEDEDVDLSVSKSHIPKSTTVYRDELGRKVATPADLPPSKYEQKQLDKEAKQKRDYQWGKGEVQKTLYASRQEEEKGPLARRIDDRDLNDYLKSKERWGDPTAALREMVIKFLLQFMSPIPVVFPIVLIPMPLIGATYTSPERSPEKKGKERSTSL